MEVTYLLMLLLLLQALVNVVDGKNMDGVIITKEDNNKEITIKVDEVFHIELEALGAAGYTWHITKLDREYLSLLSEGTKSIYENKIGASIVQYWQIKAFKKGYTEIQMLCFRPWEGAESSLEKFSIKLNID